MSTKPKRTLILPNPDRSTSEIEIDDVVVIVGRNGSGKSRLGAWMELDSNHYRNAHRISAQKSISFPERVSPKDMATATAELRFGHPDAFDGSRIDFLSSKRNFRYGRQSPSTFLVSDYAQLMVFLMSEAFAKSSKYLQAAQQTEMRVPPPLTKLSVAKRIWQEVLPDRQLEINGSELLVTVANPAPGGKPYSPMELSDGERVVFYMIGQCLAAPEDAVIIVDEPEAHLHRSIQLPLWNAIRRERQDCVFVFITHDIEFASALLPATRIWVKGFNGVVWNWEVLAQGIGFPEEVRLQILGSRRDTILVEGENSSLDVALYRELFPAYFILPKGSSRNVIEAVKALTSDQGFHHLKVMGLIDRDRLSDIQVDHLKTNGIGTLEVAEVENLFITEEICEIVAQHLHKNKTDTTLRVIDYVIKAFEEELDIQVAQHAGYEISFRLNGFTTKHIDPAATREAINDCINTLSVEEIFERLRSEFAHAVLERNYKRILRWYNRKSLPNRVAPIFGLSVGHLQKLVIELARSSERERIIGALSLYVPFLRDSDQSGTDHH